MRPSETFADVIRSSNRPVASQFESEVGRPCETTNVREVSWVACSTEVSCTSLSLSRSNKRSPTNLPGGAGQRGQLQTEESRGELGAILRRVNTLVVEKKHKAYLRVSF